MRKIIQAFDLFPALPTLRVQGEPEVSNICGGIFSLAVFAIFIYVFIASTISIISLERITATEMTEVTPIFMNVDEKSQFCSYKQYYYGCGPASEQFAAVEEYFPVPCFYPG